MCQYVWLYSLTVQIMGGIWFQEMADFHLESITEILPGIDCEEEKDARRWDRLVAGKSPNVNRNREEAAHRLRLDYFSECSVYSS